MMIIESVFENVMSVNGRQNYESWKKKMELDNKLIEPVLMISIALGVL